MARIIRNLDDLKIFKEHDIVITKLSDESCDMTTIEVDGIPVMSGNSEDFYPGCHGGWHYELAKESGDYRSSNGFINAVKKALKNRGVKSVEVVNKEYDWNTYFA